MDNLPYFFFRPFPPARLQQGLSCWLVKPPANFSCRITHHNRVRLHITTNHCLACDNSAVPNGNAGQYSAICTKPDIAANHDIPSARSLSDNKIGGLNFLERAFHGQLNRHSKRVTSWFLVRIHLALPSFNTHRWDLCWFSGLSRRQNMHPFQIVGHGHQLPFARGRLQAS